MLFRSNTAFREGYTEIGVEQPQSRAFEPAPTFPGYLSKPSNGSANGSQGANTEALVQAITDQVLAAIR